MAFPFPPAHCFEKSNINLRFDSTLINVSFPPLWGSTILMIGANQKIFPNETKKHSVQLFCALNGEKLITLDAF